MTKKMGTVIVISIVFTLLLAGCNRPASKGATEIKEQPFTTPIVLQTDSPMLITQTEVAKYIETATLSEEGGPLTSPTVTPEPTEVIIIPTITVPAEYTVALGDTIYCLGRRFDVNPNDIIALNNTEFIYPGDVLQIPQDSSWPTESRVWHDHPTTHTVSADETTINAVACYYGDVSPEAIIAANGLEEPYNLTPGQTLSIP